MSVTLRRAPLKALRFNAFLALVVWTGWYFMGGDEAIRAISEHWVISVTMIFGSLVGGGTSEGGGAVAFPVFTKLLGIPPQDARVFSLAIQSIGMGCASLAIIYMRIKIEWRAILWAGGAGIVGIILCTFFLLPVVAPPLVRIVFTVMVCSLAIALILLNRGEHKFRNEEIPVFGGREKAFLMMAGFIGGILSGLVGCGENIATFTLLVLLFRVCEKVATPTTVILMTIVTIVGFGLHVFVTGHFTETVKAYWLAAVPIVCVGAPLGAFICAHMKREHIVWFLIFLITLEFISTVLIIKVSPMVMLTAGITLLVCGLVNWRMCQIKTYTPKGDI